jgi:GNAT superfamily N-acetyltransferase
LVSIVRLLKDDDLGAGRESDDIALYEAAFEQIASNPNQLILVGLCRDDVVATLELVFMPSLTLAGTKRAQIEGVRVARSHRGRGIGADLVGRAIELARAEGCGLIQLTTDRRRESSADFYEHLGFADSHHGMKLPI